LEDACTFWGTAGFFETVILGAWGTVACVLTQETFVVWAGLGLILPLQIVKKLELDFFYLEEFLSSFAFDLFKSLLGAINFAS
jgi:hypothetical protein